MVLDERQIDDVWGNGSLASTLGREALDPATEAALVRQWEPWALRMARYITRRFHGTAEQEQDDLDQIARLGLLQAARRFDPRRNCPFGTFAFQTIAGLLLHYIRDRTPALRIPRRWFDLRPRLMRLAAELVQVLEREPTVPELAERLGVSEEDVAGALRAQEFYRPASLDVMRAGAEGDEYEPLAGQIGAEDPVLEALELRVALQQLLTALPERLRLFYREAGDRSKPTLQSAAFPTLDEAQIAEIVRFADGPPRRYRDGETVFAAGDRDYKFLLDTRSDLNRAETAGVALPEGAFDIDTAEVYARLTAMDGSG